MPAEMPGCLQGLRACNCFGGSSIPPALLLNVASALGEGPGCCKAQPIRGSCHFTPGARGTGFWFCSQLSSGQRAARALFTQDVGLWNLHFGGVRADNKPLPCSLSKANRKPQEFNSGHHGFINDFKGIMLLCKPLSLNGSLQLRGRVAAQGSTGESLKVQIQQPGLGMAAVSQSTSAARQSSV